MAGVRRKLKKGTDKYQGWYLNAAGKQAYFTGTRNRKETLHMAQRFEDEHRQVKLDYRPAPTSAKKAQHIPFADVVDEYLAWGAAQGGRGNRGWSDKHGRLRARQLDWWVDQLGLETLADLGDGALVRVERELRGLLKLGRTGKTVSLYQEALRALCLWCVQRGFLSTDPLSALAPFDTTPQFRRRAITRDELTRLLAVPPPWRRLLYETAFASGLRVNELKSLTVAHLDVERAGLLLDAEWTKNRKAGFQPLPPALVQRLHAFGLSKEARRIYKEKLRMGHGYHEPPTNPLLYVPTQPSRVLTKDLEAAGIPVETPQGRLDFHAARVGYINFLIDSGKASPKEVQELARHSTIDLTMNTYGRAREDRARDAVNSLDELMQPDEKYASCMPQDDNGAETENATPSYNKELRSVVSGGGSRVRTCEGVRQ